MLPQFSVCFAPQLLASLFLLRKHLQMEKKKKAGKKNKGQAVESLQFSSYQCLWYPIVYVSPRWTMDHASLSAGLQIELTNLMFTLNIVHIFILDAHDTENLLVLKGIERVKTKQAMNYLVCAVSLKLFYDTISKGCKSPL